MMGKVEISGGFPRLPPWMTLTGGYELMELRAGVYRLYGNNDTMFLLFLSNIHHVTPLTWIAKGFQNLCTSP